MATKQLNRKHKKEWEGWSLSYARKQAAAHRKRGWHTVSIRCAGGDRYYVAAWAYQPTETTPPEKFWPTI